MSISVLQDNKFELIGEGTLDERNRLALTKAVEVLRAIFGGDVKKVHFAIYSNKAGQILLSPETTIPLHEAWLFKNKAALASVLTGIKQARRGRVREIGSFAQYASEDAE